MPAVELTRRVRGGLAHYTVEEIDSLGVDLVITARDGGVSEGPFASLNLAEHVGDDLEAVAENRRRLARALGAPVVFARQVHGAAAVAARAVGPDTDADALTHDGTDLALGTLVADCVPILLVDPGRRIAVAHAGWRGLDRGVIDAALAPFDDPARTVALVGPSISGHRYQVGPDVAERFARYGDALAPDGPGHWRLDLRAVARAQLGAAGLEPGAVLHSTAVTDGGATFFSDRASRPCGRFALVARRRAS